MGHRRSHAYALIFTSVFAQAPEFNRLFLLLLISMKCRRIKWIVVGLTAVLCGCIYTSNERYMVDPVPGDPAVVSATVNLDTVNVNPYSDSLLVTYEFSVDGGKLYYVQSLIETYSIYEFLTDYDPDTLNGPYVLADSFWLDVAVPPDSGIYTLYLDFYYSSNTNSLGDILGVEADVLTLQFMIDFKGESR